MYGQAGWDGVGGVHRDLSLLKSPSGFHDANTGAMASICYL